MCVTGVEMMMGVMVCISIFNWSLVIDVFFWVFFSPRKIPIDSVVGAMQLCYFVPGSIQIAVHSQDLCELILRVSLMIYSVVVNKFTSLSFYLYKVACVILMFAGGGFNISPLKSRNGRPRAQVQQLMQIDLKGWAVGYFPAFQQHCLLQMLNNVAGWFLASFLVLL